MRKPEPMGNGDVRLPPWLIAGGWLEPHELRSSQPEPRAPQGLRDRLFETRRCCLCYCSDRAPLSFALEVGCVLSSQHAIQLIHEFPAFRWSVWLLSV